jgi:RNA polymerase II subunit A C-terminal domain phosphatase
MRADTLKDVHILFSSVIPLDTKPESTEIWRVAHMFGAKCYTEHSSQVTHVVAAKVSRSGGLSDARCSLLCVQHGTVKVDAARKRGGTKIVWLSWFTDSIALWHRQDETLYLLDDPSLAVPQPSSSSPNLDSQISADENDVWDEELTSTEKATGPEFDLGEIDWNDVNDEVDAAMNESDDDDDSKSEKSGMKSANASDDEGSGTDSGHSGIRCALPDI